MNITLLGYLTIIVAFISLVIGLTLFSLSIRKGYARSHTILVTSWPFLALSIAMFLFLLFPGSTSSGTFFGISITGTGALFMLVWYFGAKASREALNLDGSVQKLEEENQNLKRQVSQATKAIELPHEISYVYQLRKKRSKKIALITGRIENVKEVDVWVSSENTNMQMSRFYERSVSGVIRYYGAKRDDVGNVVEDVIANELMKIRGNNLYVHPGTVLVTGSGELQNTHNVKKIFHVASVQGEVGQGYRPIKNVEQCVINALAKADSVELKSLNIKSIAFPLIGTGTAQGNLKEIAQKLIQAAILYLETTGNSSLERVYFLTWTDVELVTCQEILQECEKLVR